MPTKSRRLHRAHRQELSALPAHRLPLLRGALRALIGQRHRRVAPPVPGALPMGVAVRLREPRGPVSNSPQLQVQPRDRAEGWHNGGHPHRLHAPRPGRLGTRRGTGHALRRPPSGPRFSPKSQAILEIQSPRISVLLGDDGPNGWGIRYAREFDMTNDSRLFPPRPQWEAKGHRRAAPTTPRHSTRPTFLRLAACSSRRRDAPRTPTPRSQPPRRAWLRPPAP